MTACPKTVIGGCQILPWRGGGPFAMFCGIRSAIPRRVEAHKTKPRTDFVLRPSGNQFCSARTGPRPTVRVTTSTDAAVRHGLFATVVCSSKWAYSVEYCHGAVPDLMRQYNNIARHSDGVSGDFQQAWHSLALRKPGRRACSGMRTRIVSKAIPALRGRMEFNPDAPPVRRRRHRTATSAAQKSAGSPTSAINSYKAPVGR